MQVFIASADRKIRLSLLLLLESEPGMVVTGVTDRIAGLPAVVDSSHPDVVLLDYQVVEAATIELVRTLRSLTYPPRVVVLALEAQANDKLLAVGADAVIGKNVPPDNLLSLLRGIRESCIGKPSRSAAE